MALSEPAAEVIAGVAILQSERDTLLNLLREVWDRRVLDTRTGELVVVLPADIAARIADEVGQA